MTGNVCILIYVMIVKQSGEMKDIVTPKNQ